MIAMRLPRYILAVLGVTLATLSLFSYYHLLSADTLIRRDVTTILQMQLNDKQIAIGVAAFFAAWIGTRSALMAGALPILIFSFLAIVPNITLGIFTLSILFPVSYLILSVLVFWLAARSAKDGMA